MRSITILAVILTELSLENPAAYAQGSSMSSYDTKLYVRGKFADFSANKDLEILVNFSGSRMELEFERIIDPYGGDPTYVRRETLDIELPYIKGFKLMGSPQAQAVKIEINCDSACAVDKSGRQHSNIIVQFLLSPRLEVERLGRALVHLAKLYQNKRSTDPFAK